MTLLVLFDSEASATQESNLVTAIKSNGSWARLLPNAWLVSTSKTSGTLRDELKGFIPGLKIVVFNVTGGGWGSSYLPDDVANWMKTNI